MRVRFSDKKLEILYTTGKSTGQFDASVVRAFFKVMSIITGASDTRDFYGLKSLHFEKLSGDRSEQHSLRLNKQWRLIIKIERDDDGQTAVILEIVDYH